LKIKFLDSLIPEHGDSNLPPVWLPANWGTLNGNLQLSSTFLNASGERITCIVQAPKAGTLDWFEYRTSTVVDNPNNGMRSSFQAVDPAAGLGTASASIAGWPARPRAYPGHACNGGCR
jgi:hypothetical protein